MKVIKNNEIVFNYEKEKTLCDEIIKSRELWETFLKYTDDSDNETFFQDFREIKHMSCRKNRNSNSDDSSSSNYHANYFVHNDGLNSGNKEIYKTRRF